jgi:formamidopyrimidine-DNA glycosylase
MPELPDITIYIEALEERIAGQVLTGVRLASPFILRSVDPPISALAGLAVRKLRRLGKQIVVQFDQDYFLIIHLMIAGRLQWKETRAKVPGKLGLAALDFPTGTLLLTEAGSKRRASLHVARGDEALTRFDRGGLNVLESSLDEFGAVLLKENHTLKRALTDPSLFSGIGNAYSDEILHRARLSPIVLTSKLSNEEISRLHDAVLRTLREWVERLRRERGSGFPTRVTAFRPDMAVHGRYGEPCPDCGSPVQRIVYAENECNYCAVCQTGGRLLADRAMSRLLRQDWPRSIDEWERHLGRRRC